jgi:uncharacterized protein (DUF111 family)
MHTHTYNTAHEHGHEHDQEHKHAHERAHGHNHHAGHTANHAGNRILTVRANSGLSGDIILSGLAKLAELEDAELNKLIAELKIPALENCLSIETRSINAVNGWICKITLPHEHAHRSMADIKQLIQASDLPEEAKNLSGAAFSLLAEAEGAVHGKKPDEITFHEVGALDSILDICLSCRIFTLLAPERFICSPLPLADGAIHCAHGCLPSPAPAVLRLLTGIPVRGFEGSGETVTPTALALLKALKASFGPWPEFTVQKTLISYGQKVFPDLPNGAIWALGASND